MGLYNSQISSCLPVVIGITGHRDLRAQDIPSLQISVSNILIEIHQHCPNSEIIVMTSLAEGADRLCARVALDLGMEIHVPLPMPQDEYEKDFNSPESINEFRELLTKSSCTFVLPDIEGADPAKYNAKRNYYYKQTGTYIARCSHILVALWDGVKHTDLPGGTYDTVNAKLNPELDDRAYKHLSVFKVENSGTVYHLVTPRVSNSETNGKPFTLVKLPITKENLKPHTNKKPVDLLNAIDMFNLDVTKLTPGLKAKISESRAGLYNIQRLPDLPLPLAKLADAFAAADCLSVYFRNKRLKALKLLSVMGLLLVLLFLLYDEMESNTMLLFYGVTLVGLFFYFFQTQRGGYHNKFVDYRVLAEGLRVQLYWKMAGVEEEAYEHYIWGHKREIQWIKVAMSSCMAYGNTRLPADNQTMMHEEIKAHWVDDQARYFEEAAKKRGGGYEKSEKFIQGLFIGSIALYLVILITEYIFGNIASAEMEFSPGVVWFLNMHEGLLVMERGLMKILFGTVAGMIAFFNNYTSNQALAEQVREYEKMHDLFIRAEDLLANSFRNGDMALFKEAVFQLGCEALRENGNWLLIKRQRPLTLPK